MPFQEVNVSRGASGKSNQQITDSCLFQELLCSEQEVGELPFEKIYNEDQALLTPDAYLTNDEGAKEDLQSLMLNAVSCEKRLDGDGSNNRNKFMSKKFSDQPIVLELLETVQQLNPVQRQAEIENTDVIQKQLARIFSKVEELLAEITTKQDIAKASPEVLKHLQQWTAVERKVGNTEGMENVLSSTVDVETKEEKIWKTLIQTFDKREGLAGKLQYNTEAKVSTVDVTKWIQNALDNPVQVDRIQGQHVASAPSMPMSKVEQFIIHLNQSQNTQSADQQLIEQFQKVMKSSRFIAKPNGVSQLSIALRPHHLGEIMVRLTQIDGEMAVKIIVSSQAAENMLKSNLHQLKSMFSPQQVLIERQETTFQQDPDVQKEQNGEQNKEQEEHQPQHSNRQQESNTDDDFAAQFHELLMNEEV